MTAWIDTNQRYLTRALDALRVRLEGGDTKSIASAEAAVAEARADMTSPPAAERISALFGLSQFERDVLLLAAGVELDARLAAACAMLNGDPRYISPTFALALSKLPSAHWSAVGPKGPLRRFALLELGPGPSLTQRTLQCSERILHCLTGVEHLDERLDGVVESVPPTALGLPSHALLVDRLARAWRHSSEGAATPLLRGACATARTAIAAAACDASRYLLDVLSAEAWMSHADPSELARLVVRDSALRGSALLVEFAGSIGHDASRLAALGRFVRMFPGPVVVSAPESFEIPALTMHVLDVGRPSMDEQRILWRKQLAPLTRGLDAPVLAAVDRLTKGFDLHAAEIAATCATVTAGDEPQAGLSERLWHACRTLTRGGFGPLAQFVTPRADWDDLVLADLTRMQLREIAAWMRHRGTVRTSWGFADQDTRGQGITALFTGPSGTGKTTAAEVLARDLQIDLWRIDLSEVVDKYIGETEKHLRRVFDAAERSGALLLFDEADALFSRRSAVRDGVDRHGNLEVAYLLQRLETHRGLVVLTTNLEHAIDPAFLRRFPFVLRFAWPTTAERAAIWRRAFPSRTPTEGLRFDELAEIYLSGASIRGVALRAAYLAADAGTPVRMDHVLAAMRAELAKLGGPRGVTGE